MTNSTLVGKSRKDLVGQTLLQVEFYNNKNEPLEPSESVVLVDETSNEYDITTEPTQHSLGSRVGGNVNEPWQLIGNSMYVTGAESTDNNRITAIFKFAFTSLTTSTMSYTKFKFVQE